MLTAPEFAALLTARSADGIARDVARLVSAGELAGGQRLPTVRSLARELGVSPTTISTAWQTLQRHGVLETGGRRGSTVRGLPQPPAPARFARLHQGAGDRALDLSAGTPDPALLPDLRRAVHAVGKHAAASSYFDQPVLPDLEAVLRTDWPFAPEALTIVNGAVDAMEQVFAATLRFGDRVLVENPTFPPILDLLEQRGIEIDGLPVDEDGLRPGALADALGAEPPPAALVVQPRAHNPSAYAMDAARAAELAGALRGAPHTLVIEDDHAAALSTAPPVSLGTHLPERTVHVRGFSKSHGPDLRLAAVGGAGDVIDRVVRARLLGPAWSSRLLQTILHSLLTDQAAIDQVTRARQTYAERRRSLTAALHERGVPVTGTDGINMWLRVHDERSALVHLAVDQITVAPGTPFLTAPLDGEHIRLTCSTVADGYDRLADRIALAAGPGTRPHRAV